MIMIFQHLKISIVLFALFLGCSPSCFRQHIHTGAPQELSPSHPDYAKTVQVKYFGASGFLIRHGESALLLAPFFSNHPMYQLLKPTSDITTINTQMSAVRLDNVKSILVGHAHYDHLLDIPHIAQEFFIKKNTPLKIFGSLTMKNLISNEKNPRGIPINNLAPLVGDSVSTKQKIGHFTYVDNTKRIRIRAIESMHAPHFAFLKFFKGKVTEPVTQMPTWVTQWKEGQTLAYLIDFLDEYQKPIFRIHFQDAASNSLVSLPHLDLIKDKAVDLSIMCVASFNNVNAYPQDILLALKPKYAILAHWEDFFIDYSINLDPKTARPVTLTDPCDFIEIVKNTAIPNLDWKMPLPGAWMFYPTK